MHLPPVPAETTTTEQSHATASHFLMVMGIALFALAVSLLFHSPRWWVFAQPMPGSTYWDRGLAFIQQCNEPLGTPLTDAGLTWRLAPALLAKALGLHGNTVFIVPWLGLVGLLALCASVVMRRTRDHRLALLSTLLVGTMGVTLTVTGWLGMNDAWYASALVAIAFLPSRPLVSVALLFGPWVDERFVLALPLALWVRTSALGRDWQPVFCLAASALSLAEYAAIRFLNLPGLATAVNDEYFSILLSGHALEWLPWAGLGFFMGLRAAWVLVAIALAGRGSRAELKAAWWPFALAAAPLLMITLLAADTGRAPTMLIPLVLFGVERLSQLRGPTSAHRVLMALLFANLIMPAMHVTYRNGDIINLLPIEIVRWLQQP